MCKWFINFMILLSFNAFSDSKQSISEIETKASTYLLQAFQHHTNLEVSIEIKPLDNRLNLAKCAKNAMIFFPPFNRSLSNSSIVGVKCLRPVRWSFYIPFNVKLYGQVAVINRNIPRNTLIASRDIRLVKQDVSKLKNGYFNKGMDVSGKVAVRALSKGQIITPEHLKQANIISKGDLVTVTAYHQGIKVSIKGVAQQNGRLGDNITVKNMTSKKIIEGKVVGNKEISIKF